MSQHNGTCRKTHCKSALEKNIIYSNYSLQKSRETKKLKIIKQDWNLKLAIDSSKN